MFMLTCDGITIVIFKEINKFTFSLVSNMVNIDK